MNEQGAANCEPVIRDFQPKRSRWFFRLATVLLGLSLFGAFELFCVAADWGRAEVGDDPFVGFTSLRPLFELTPDRRWYHTSPDRRGFFKEDSFAAIKPPTEFRIFVFGGSTVQGNPFSIETSFPTYLQISLCKADPGHQWKVVNCGGVSYASYRLLPIMQECLSYEPDLFIFCEGHNEFLEDVTYAGIRETSAVVQQGYTLLSRLRSFRLLQNSLQSQPSSFLSSPPSVSRDIRDTGKPLLDAEVNTLLDHDGGLAAYHRDDLHSAAVHEHFRSNLQRMADMCRAQAVPLLMVLPPSNLSDCPPFKSEHSGSTTDEQREQIQTLLRDARAVSSQDLHRAIDIVKAATAIDPRYAFSWYELGQLQLFAGDNSAAESSFCTARDEDICRLRITTPLENALRETAASNAIPLVDAQDLLRSGSSNVIVGENVLVDHVHPSFGGHEDIAIAIAKTMLSQGLLSAADSEWELAARRECDARLQALGDLYFLRGRRALENLKHWAAGRSGGPPLQPRK